ncbi:MAG: hypothetical protein R2911_29100 [Caldilineaceae bacterium]
MLVAHNGALTSSGTIGAQHAMSWTQRHRPRCWRWPRPGAVNPDVLVICTAARWIRPDNIK